MSLSKTGIPYGDLASNPCGAGCSNVANCPTCWARAFAARTIATSPTVRFDANQAQAAADAWGFNCGPGALCAVLDLMPEDLLPVLRGMGFERKRYMSPTMMQHALYMLRVNVRVHPRGGIPAGGVGLIRVQWDGPWMQRKDDNAWREQYRHTHWIAWNAVTGELQVFDINAICAGGWMSYAEWSNQLVPWLLNEGGLTAKGANGKFSFTHIWELYE